MLHPAPAAGHDFHILVMRPEGIGPGLDPRRLVVMGNCLQRKCPANAFHEKLKKVETIFST
jgi:hypothetical protein